MEAPHSKYKLCHSIKKKTVEWWSKEVTKIYTSNFGWLVMYLMEQGLSSSGCRIVSNERGVAFIVFYTICH
jgi:hypothetical protein